MLGADNNFFFLASVQQTERILMSGAQCDSNMNLSLCMQLANGCDVLLSNAIFFFKQAQNDDTSRVPIDIGFDKNVRCIFSVARLLNVITCWCLLVATQRSSMHVYVKRITGIRCQIEAILLMFKVK